MLNFKSTIPNFKNIMFNFKNTMLNSKKCRNKAYSSIIPAPGFLQRAARKTFFTGLLYLLILSVAVFALAACEPAGQQTIHDANALAVHFIDVGQGDAILVQAPGAALLIDGGPGTAGQKVVDYLKKAGIAGIDLVISTHPHEDHIGGLLSVLQNFPVGEVIDPAVVHTTKTFKNYLTLIDEKDIIFTEGRAGMHRDLGGGAVLAILHPVSPSGQHLNNASIVARLTFGQTAFLFTGDAEEEAEAEILRRGVNSKATSLRSGTTAAGRAPRKIFCWRWFRKWR